MPHVDDIPARIVSGSLLAWPESRPTERDTPLPVAATPGAVTRTRRHGARDAATPHDARWEAVLFARPALHGDSPGVPGWCEHLAVEWPAAPPWPELADVLVLPADAGPTADAVLAGSPGWTVAARPAGPGRCHILVRRGAEPSTAFTAVAAAPAVCRLPPVAYASLLQMCLVRGLLPTSATGSVEFGVSWFDRPVSAAAARGRVVVGAGDQVTPRCPRPQRPTR